MCDLLDYHEGSLGVICKKITQLASLTEGAKDVEKKKDKEDFYFYRKATSYAKSMKTSSITDTVHMRLII